MIHLTGSDTIGNIVSTVHANLATEWPLNGDGWYESASGHGLGSLLWYISGGRLYLSMNPRQNPGNHSFTASYLGVQASGASPTDLLRYELIIGADHFLLTIEGPRAGETGAENATYGSGKGYFMMDTFTPWYPVVLQPQSENNGNYVWGSNVNNTSFSTTEWLFTPNPTSQPGSSTPARWSVQTGSMMQMNQSSTAGTFFDAIKTGTKIPYWYIDVSHGDGGHVGSLDNFFYGGGNYRTANDPVYADYYRDAGDREGLIDSKKYATIALTSRKDVSANIHPLGYLLNQDLVISADNTAQPIIIARVSD